MKKVKTYKTIGDSSVTYLSDTEGGVYYDTEVLIGGEFICCIAGDKISEFHEKLEEIISKYRI